MSILSYANQNVYELVAYQPGKPIEETARELGMRPEDIVKLASNENSLGPSPLAVQAMQRAAAGAHIVSISFVSGKFFVSIKGNSFCVIPRTIFR